MIRKVIVIAIVFFLGCTGNGEEKKVSKNCSDILFSSVSETLSDWGSMVNFAAVDLVIKDDCSNVIFVVKGKRDSFPLEDRVIEVEYLASELLKNDDFSNNVDTFFVTYIFEEVSEKFPVLILKKDFNKIEMLFKNKKYELLTKYLISEIDVNSRRKIRDGIKILSKKESWFNYEEDGVRIMQDYFLHKVRGQDDLDKEVNKLIWLLEGVKENEAVKHLKYLKEMADEIDFR